VAAGSGEAREVTARFTSHAGLVSVAVRPLALKRELVFALRLRLSDNDISADQLEAAISRLLHDSDDCVAVTDAAGHIVVCNQAFVRLLRLTSQEAAVGRPIVDWLSVEGGSWAELRDDLRGRGVMRDLPGQVVQQTAAVAAVQVTATLLLEGDQERIGFRLHAEPAEATPGDSFRRELEELSARIGEACLSDLLEHAEHAVERYLTRRAMEIAKGDAVSAARVLGVDPERVLRAYAPEPGSDE